MPIPQDGTSGWYLPETAAQWTELLAGSGIANPNHLYLCQEAAGDLADSIGSGTLVVVNPATVIYQKPVAGWSRVGVAPTVAGASSRFVNSAFVNPSTTSVTVLVLLKIGAPDGNSRDLFAVGASSDISFQSYDVGSGKRIRYRDNSVVLDSDLANPTATNQVVPIILTIDIANGIVAWMIDNEHRFPAYGVPSSTTSFGLGSVNATWQDSTIIYAAVWTGAGAELTEAQRVSLRERLESGPPPAAGGDITAPTVTIVSPTPGVPPGDPGGFSADWTIARETEIVVAITDAAPGLEYACVVATFPGQENEVVVYRRGAFRGDFATRSWTEVVANGIRLHCLPSGWWPVGSHAELEDIRFAVDAIDGDGNLAA